MEELLSHELLEHPLFVQALGIGGLLLVCLLAHGVTRRFIVRGIERLILRSETSWDDALHDAELFQRLALLVPAFIAYSGVNALPKLEEGAINVISRVAAATMLLVGARAVNAFLTAANTIYSENPQNASHPIKGYVQVGKIIVSVIATILVLATLLDRSPLIFLSGLGAMTAVLLLVFRDTILSLVASVQISGNDMVRVGDWIEMPQFGADGDVIDVALHTVKVQNWDKTVTTIPTHRLITDSFKNWRFMSQSGGRRIKRSLAIDMGTVRFLEDDEIDHVGEFALMREYIAEKRKELAANHAREGLNPEYGADVRRLTNLGTFRAYIEHYLDAHPRIHSSGMTLLVRQLAPSELGVPIELYCFTTTTDWNAYEAIQADIFDHLLAVAPEFGLAAFQNPSGSDFAELLSPEG
jgi:miniconductance mechanosensitive channel